ncbi:MAG: lysophospholipid acyltransferase family protein [Vicingaceae bacterium]|nr:lysophospholipid acyltransferase family protein [Vicingaceae bacterium]
MITFIRFFLMAIWSAVLMVVSPLLIPFFFSRKVPLFVGRYVFSPVLLPMVGIDLTTHGAENVPQDRPVIFVSNHCSHFDIACLFRALPRYIYFVAKKELLWTPFLGFHLWAAGHILIDRKNRVKAVKSLRKAALKIKGGKCVTLYPEGTRSTDGEVGPFKKGAFHLAIDAGVDVVPVHIDGTFKIWPKGRFTIKPGKVTVNIGKPIITANYTKQTSKEFAEKTREEVLKLKG